MILLACLLLAAPAWSPAWSNAAQAADSACAEMSAQVAGHVTGHISGDCDKVPADADKGYPHCHSGCHGHNIATPVPAQAHGKIATIASTYAPAAAITMALDRADRQLRPPQA